MSRKKEKTSVRELKTYLIRQPIQIDTSQLPIDASIEETDKTLHSDASISFTNKEYILFRDLISTEQESLRQYINYQKNHNESLDFTNSQILILKKDVSMYPTLHDIANFPNRGLRFCSKEIYDCWKNIAFYDKESNDCGISKRNVMEDSCSSSEDMISRIEEMINQCVFEDELLKVIEIAQNRIASLNDMVGGNSIDDRFQMVNRQINMKRKTNQLGNQKTEKKEKKRVVPQLIPKEK